MGSSGESPLALELDDILSRYTSPQKTEGSIRGAAFVVRSANGKVEYDGSSGRLDSTSDESFTPDTVCEIASMTKLVTVVAVLQLVEQGLVDLEQDLGRIIPGLANLDVLSGFHEGGEPILTKQTQPLTLTHLLTHSSGFGYDVFDPDLMKWRSATKSSINWNSFSREALQIPLKFQPGEGWVYGIGLDWAGCVVEKLSGVSLEAYMQSNIFKPLGMKSTTFRPDDYPYLQQKRAVMTLRSEAKGALSSSGPMKGMATDLDCGGVGLISSAAEYAKLLAALLNDGGDILSAESVRKLYIPRLNETQHLESNLYGPMQYIFAPEYPEGAPTNYALGGAVNMKDLPERRREGSIMWSGMTNGRWWIDPQSGLAAALFVQMLPPGDASVAELYRELEKAVYSLKP